MNPKVFLLFLFALLILPMASASTSVRCLDNMTMVENISMSLNISGNMTLIETSETTDCAFGCSSMTNVCRQSLDQQILLIGIITGGFFGLLILSLFLSKTIPFIDIIVSLVLGIFSAILGLTDIFSLPLGYIFYGWTLVFIASIAILMYKNLWR